MKHITDFVRVCKTIGKDRMMVAAGGGNISVKLDSKQMIIKASGTDLSALTERAGHVLVDYSLIREYIKTRSKNSEPNEAEYNEALRKGIIGEQDFRPSIETGFHALLGPAIIHTHPVLVNAIACCIDGRSIIEKVFGPDALWAPYESPGLDLSIEILNLVADANLEDLKKSTCIFLENHGLIVSGPDLDECLQTTYKVTRKIEDYLKSIGVELYEYESVSNVEQNGGSSRLISRFMEDESNKKFLEGFIFPDAIVYCGCGFTACEKDTSKISLHANGLIEMPDNMKTSREKTLETALTIIHTLLLARRIGEPKTLTDNEVEAVRNMTGEKYRQKVR